MVTRENLGCGCWLADSSEPEYGLAGTEPSRAVVGDDHVAASHTSGSTRPSAVREAGSFQGNFPLSLWPAIVDATCLEIARVPGFRHPQQDEMKLRRDSDVLVGFSTCKIIAPIHDDFTRDLFTVPPGSPSSENRHLPFHMLFVFHS